MANHKLSPADIAKCKLLYENGTAAPAIAAPLGVTHDAVTYHAKRNRWRKPLDPLGDVDQAQRLTTPEAQRVAVALLAELMQRQDNRPATVGMAQALLRPIVAHVLEVARGSRADLAAHLEELAGELRAGVLTGQPAMAAPWN